MKLPAEASTVREASLQIHIAPPFLHFLTKSSYTCQNPFNLHTKLTHTKNTKIAKLRNFGLPTSNKQFDVAARRRFHDYLDFIKHAFFHYLGFFLGMYTCFDSLSIRFGLSFIIFQFNHSRLKYLSDLKRT